ncbi:MAG: hypothetical protein ACRYE9_04365 [Janthinobacterium lividum]
MQGFVPFVSSDSGKKILDEAMSNMELVQKLSQEGIAGQAQFHNKFKEELKTLEWKARRNRQ